MGETLMICVHNWRGTTLWRANQRDVDVDPPFAPPAVHGSIETFKVPLLIAYHMRLSSVVYTCIYIYIYIHTPINQPVK